MKLKSVLDRLSGRTSSSNVDVLKRTHLDGDVFCRQVIINQNSEEIKRREKELDKDFPNEPKHKLPGEQYRVTFNLNMKNRPDDTKLWELVKLLQEPKNYKAYTENNTYYDFNVKRFVTGGPIFKGYKVLEWLIISTKAVDELMPNSFISAFQVEYEEMQITTNANGQRTSNLTKVVKKNVDVFIQKIIISEATLFVNNCIEIVSPN